MASPSPMSKANEWAATATRDELRAYAAACLRQMTREELEACRAFAGREAVRRAMSDLTEVTLPPDMLGAPK